MRCLGVLLLCIPRAVAKPLTAGMRTATGDAEQASRKRFGSDDTAVAGVSIGAFDCSALYDHRTWSFELSENDVVDAKRVSFLYGSDDYVTWTGELIDEHGSVSVTWRESDPCNRETLLLVMHRGEMVGEDGATRIVHYQSSAGHAVPPKDLPDKSKSADKNVANTPKEKTIVINKLLRKLPVRSSRRVPTSPSDGNSANRRLLDAELAADVALLREATLPASQQDAQNAESFGGFNRFLETVLGQFPEGSSRAENSATPQMASQRRETESFLRGISPVNTPERQESDESMQQTSKIYAREADGNYAQLAAIHQEAQTTNLEEENKSNEMEMHGITKLDDGAVAMRSGRRLDAGNVVDVMFLWTQRAMEQLGGRSAARTAVNLVVAHVNSALIASGVPGLQFRLVHTGSVPYSEGSKALGDSLDDLTDGYVTWSDGSVDALRVKYGADLVQLIRVSSPNDSSAGIAWVFTPDFVDAGSAFYDYGYSVVAAEYFLPGSVSAHELGHQFGLNHNIEDAGIDRASRFPQGLGQRYCNSDGSGFITIMSYYCTGWGNPTIMYYSNPKVTYKGVTTGIADKTDNAGVFSITRFTVANFLSSKAASKPSPSPRPTPRPTHQTHHPTTRAHHPTARAPTLRPSAHPTPKYPTKMPTKMPMKPPTKAPVGAGACVGQYDQCAGKLPDNVTSWKTCCIFPYTCNYSNPYYSQCV